MGLSQNPGDTLFNSLYVHDINITFTQPKFWDSLMFYKHYADSLNLSTQSMMGSFYVDGTLIDSVGVQLKGNSTYGYPGQKKSIKIKFNQYVAGKYFRFSNVSMSARYAENFTTGYRTNLSFDMNTFAMLKKYIGVFAGGGAGPTNDYDYYEPRVPGLVYL